MPVKCWVTTILNFLNLMIDEEGKLNLDVEDEIVQDTCITRDGEIVNERVKAAL